MITNTTMSVDEIVESLTGYEELAVEKSFGQDPNALLDAKPFMGMRALAFILVARDLEAQDVKDATGKAYKHVMGMTLKQVGDFYPEAEEEPIPDEPRTEPGKDDSQPD